MRRITAVIADRHPVVLYGLMSLLSAESDFDVVASCRDGVKCLDAIRELAPDIAVIDVLMPGLSGLKILGYVNSELLPTRVVFMTAALEDRELIKVAAKGAHGVVLKEAAPEVLVDCIRQVAGGQKLLSLATLNGGSQGNLVSQNLLNTLTDREHQIAQLVSEGLSNKEVGRRLNISDGTIKVHLHNIYQKLAISNRTALAVWASHL
jgi:two-component system, NarL family, nitrate/nitrite response regulator NarL